VCAFIAFSNINGWQIFVLKPPTDDAVDVAAAKLQAFVRSWHLSPLKRDEQNGFFLGNMVSGNQVFCSFGLIE
jgi:hypothetical protein